VCVFVGEVGWLRRKIKEKEQWLADKANLCHEASL
jgi:hypothetical protein